MAKNGSLGSKLLFSRLVFLKFPEGHQNSYSFFLIPTLPYTTNSDTPKSSDQTICAGHPVHCNLGLYGMEMSCFVARFFQIMLIRVDDIIS